MYKVFSAGIMKEKGKYIPRHAHHNLCEIIYYTEGKGRFEIGGTTLKFKEGDIVYVPPDTPHHGMSKDGFLNASCILFPLDIFGKEYFVIHDNYSHEFKQIILQVINNYLIQRVNWEGICSALIAVMIEYMNTWKSQSSMSNISDICERIIIANIANCDFSVEMLCDNVSLSKSQLARILKKESGYTPTVLLCEKRMKYATDILKDYSYKQRIKDVALMCGYRDPYHFSRVFKQKHGLSPEEWRKLNQEKIPGI